MHALPRQHASHSEKNNINFLWRENCSARFRPEKTLDLGNAGGNRASPSPTCSSDPYAIPVISIAAVPQQWRDRTARSYARIHFSDRARRECNRKNTISPFSEKDRWSIEPFLQGEEQRGGLPISESALDLRGKVSPVFMSTATAPPQRKRDRHREERW